MFENDVTQNYQLQDATFEILIMLAGAFLLGTLFCWALGKLRGNKRKHPYQRKTVDQQNGYKQPAQQAGATYPDDTENNLLRGTAGGAAGILGGSLATASSDIANAGSSLTDRVTTSASVAGERLAKASPAIPENLPDIPDNGANNIADKLAQTGSSMTEGVSDTVSRANEKLTNTESAVVDSVTSRSSTTKDKLANTGSFITDKVTTTANATEDKLVSSTSSIKESLSDTLDATEETFSDAKSSIKEKTSGVLDNTKDNMSEANSVLSSPLEATDNFKKIEGIGPKIETALHTAGIRTYADLRASDHDTLKAVLTTASSAFKMHDPETWPYQADLAYNKKWEKLKEYQDFLMGRDE
ncbi:MAG: hypothetical protein KAH03_00160 [Cocleimonas sp.]|nr:hypothetical protein [Cocleimonas sp.]